MSDDTDAETTREPETPPALMGAPDSVMSLWEAAAAVDARVTRCSHDYDVGHGWHDCPEQQALEQLQDAVEAIGHE